MKKLWRNIALLGMMFVITAMAGDNVDKKGISTDSLYRELIRTVVEVDFKAMAATYHPDAILVTSKKSQSIGPALIKWEKDGIAQQKVGTTASVAFRFSKRLVGETTAFEKGIFRYATTTKDGKETVFFAHFEDLNVFKQGRWQTMMEHQVKVATKAEWLSLPAWH